MTYRYRITMVYDWRPNPMGYDPYNSIRLSEVKTCGHRDWLPIEGVVL
jgi:hypothetical protein